MPSLSKKLRDADILTNEFNNTFRGKYSPSGNSEKFNVSELCSLISTHRFRLGIMVGICFLSTILLLSKIKPKMIMSTKISFQDRDTVDTWKLIKWSVIFTGLLAVSIFIASYRFPMLKKLLFKSEDCDTVCQM